MTVIIMLVWYNWEFLMLVYQQLNTVFNALNGTTKIKVE